MRTKRLVIGLTITLTIGLAGEGVAGDKDWIVRGFGAWADPDISYTDSADDGSPVTTFTNADLGFGAGLERRVSRRLGLELQILTVGPDLGLRADVAGQSISITDTLRMTPILLGATIHFTPESPVDVWANAGFAHVSFGDLRYEPPVGDPLELKTGDTTGWSAAAGVDVRLGTEGWVLTASLRHLDIGLDVSGVGDPPGTVAVDANTLIGAIGVGYRF